MANENAPIGQINPSNLVGKFQPQTDATSNFVQAIRAGVVNVNDIVQGIDRHSQMKAQLTAQELGLREQFSPENVEMRQAQTALGTAQAQSGLRLLPDMETAARLKAQGAAYADAWQKLGFSLPQIAEMQSQGFSFEANKTHQLPNEADQAYASKAWQQLSEFKQYRRIAEEVLKQDPKIIGAGAGVQRPYANGKFWSPAEVEGIRSWYARVQRAADMQPTDKAMFGGGAPGTVAQPAAPVVVPNQPVYTPGQGQPPYAPQPTATVAPAAPVEPAEGSAPQVVQRGVQGAPQIGYDPVTGIDWSQQKGVEGKPLTEREGNVGIGLSRMLKAEETLWSLNKSGFDPASAKTWAQNILPNIPGIGALKGQPVRSFNQAKALWSQGLLRLESGAAIAYKEQKWYEDTFFPAYGDDANVIEQKRESRTAVMQWMHQILQAKVPPTAELNQQYQQFIDSEADKIASVQSGATPLGNSGFSLPNQPTQNMGPRRLNAPVQQSSAPVTLNSGKKIQIVGRDANGLPLFDYVQ